MAVEIGVKCAHYCGALVAELFDVNVQ